MIYTSPNRSYSYVMGSSPEDIDTSRSGSDRYLLIAVITLMMFGILAVYSSIAYFAESKDTSAGALIFGHVIKLGIAFIVMLITSKINYHTIAKLSHLGVVISWILLIAVLAFGTETFGAKRWLNIAGFSFQPSSVASVALLIHISVLLSEKQAYIKDFKKAFMPVMFWVLGTCALIGLEDFSSAGLLLGMSMIVMFVGRVSMIQLGALVIIGILGGSILLSQSPVRQSRVEQYLTQIKDIKSDEFVLEDGYQAQQSFIAIAKGEVFGVGIGKSTQRDFLPAPYNDFIFAIVAEEYGMFGSGILVLIFSFILIRGIVYIARNAEDSLGMLIALSCTLTIALYGFVNALVACGLLPVTGLPMPFVSYGGTNMLFAGFMVGLLLNISKHKKDRRSVFYA